MGTERFTEVAIVGGGVIGASIAAHLAERRVGRVVVFEREDALGTGSTAVKWRLRKGGLADAGRLP